MITVNLLIQLQFKSKLSEKTFFIIIIFINNENTNFRTLQQYGASSISLEESLDNVVTVSDEGDLTPLIIVSSVLGVLLLCTILGTFLMWWYKIHPYEYKQMEDDSGSVSSQQVLRNNNESLNIESSPVGRFTVQKKDSVTLAGTTINGNLSLTFLI